MLRVILLLNLFLRVSILVLSLVCLFSSCEKYLDAKPNSNLLVPSSTDDLIKLLDYDPFMNNSSSMAGDFCSESFYYSDEDYAYIPEESKYGYTWNDKMFTHATGDEDWQKEYNVVYYANIVLEGLDKIERTTQNMHDWDYCRGAALLFRAKSFYEVAQIWALAYNSSTASGDLGIPLRLDSDFNKPTHRASLQDTYTQIINDLEEALQLLPLVQVHPFRPTKPAAYGFLARTYLAMRDYNKAGIYADSCLQIRNGLIDYNEIDSTVFYPFGPIVFKNTEDIMYSTLLGYTLDGYATLYYTANIDRDFYNSYSSDDLRKSNFFKPKGNDDYYFVGMYGNRSGGGNLYNGLTTAEMYLIRAESLARQEKVADALNDLNTLLKKRWRHGSFVPFVAENSEHALRLILEERHKELFMRGTRFTDIKRLNMEGRNIVLTRIANGERFELLPNSNRFALPIPERVIQLTGIQQN